MSDSAQDFRQAAHNTFVKLSAAFAANGNYWQLGHTLDTIIDYLTIAPADAVGFAKIALDRYNVSSTNGTACWYDDFSWWGIAGLKASQRPNLFGDDTAKFSSIAQSCWETTDGKAPYVWANADQQAYAELRPRIGADTQAVDGGVWNYYWGPFTGGCSPDDPRGDECPPTMHGCLCGYQNTVTNGLYLVLSSRLAQANPQVPHYRQAADREFNFFYNWFELSEPDPLTTPLLNRYTVGKAVVRERVSTYAPKGANPPYPPVQCYNPSVVWTGDQGLILGGMVDRMQLVGPASPLYPYMRNVAQSIAAGVLDSLTTNALLQPWTPNQPSPCGDDGDYLTGPAVYMRYMLYAFLTNADIRNYLRAANYPVFVQINATNVVKYPSSDMVGLTNDLATLVAAIVMPATE